MENMEGKQVPNVTFKTRHKDESGDYDWKDVSTNDLFDGKKVVVVVDGKVLPASRTFG